MLDVQKIQTTILNLCKKILKMLKDPKSVHSRNQRRGGVQHSDVTLR